MLLHSSRLHYRAATLYWSAHFLDHLEALAEGTTTSSGERKPLQVLIRHIHLRTGINSVLTSVLTSVSHRINFFLSLCTYEVVNIKLLLFLWALSLTVELFTASLSCCCILKYATIKSRTARKKSIQKGCCYSLVHTVFCWLMHKNTIDWEAEVVCGISLYHRRSTYIQRYFTA